MEQTQPTRLFIDCEFNEFKGDLISMGIVAEDGREFYEVTHCDQPGAWVAQHVMPILNKAPISMRELQAQLFLFLAQFKAIHVVADWPEDIKHFCDALITGPGMRMDTPPLTMEVRRDLDSELSAVPHNALDDARAVAAKAAELGLLRSLQPVSGGDWLEEQDFYEAMQGYRCAPPDDQREVVAHFEHVKRFIRARISAPQAVGWMDISTAPKDGAEIILRRGARITAGHWMDEKEVLGSEFHNNGTYLGEYPTGEVHEARWLSWDGGFTAEEPPTHWQPLPAPPTQQGDGNG